MIKCVLLYFILFPCCIISRFSELYQPLIVRLFFVHLASLSELEFTLY